jgi:hypothetical protein
MMQPTEDRLSPDFTSPGQSMSIHRSRPGQGLILINTLIRGYYADVWAAFVGMANPMFQHYSQWVTAASLSSVTPLSQSLNTLLHLLPLASREASVAPATSFNVLYHSLFGLASRERFSP